MSSAAVALTGVGIVGVDTSPFIYLIERHPRYVGFVREVIARIDAGELLAATSVVTLTEVLARPIQAGRADVQREYTDILLNSGRFELMAIDTDDAVAAAELRARYALRTPDALQLAVAIRAGCDAFLTNDVRLKRVSELRIVLLDEHVGSTT